MRVEDKSSVWKARIALLVLSFFMLMVAGSLFGLNEWRHFLGLTFVFFCLVLLISGLSSDFE